jgi:hypothetical protein
LVFPIALFGGLIATLWVVLFFGKAGNCLNLTTEDRIIAYLILILTAGGFILQALSLARVSPGIESYSFDIEVFLFAIGAILVLALVVLRRRHKKIIPTPYTGLGPSLTKKDVPKLAEKLRVLKKAQRPELKKAASDAFQSNLGMLPFGPLPRWWGWRLRRVVFDAMDYIQTQMAEPDFDEREQGIIWLKFIIEKLRKDKKTIKRAQSLFLKTVDDFDHDPEFRKDPQGLDNLMRDVLLLRQQLHEYEEKFMLSLADEAIFDWDVARFGARGSNIRVNEILVTDKETFQRVKEHFLDIIDKAEKSDRANKQTIIDNANAFFGMVRNK